MRYTITIDLRAVVRVLFGVLFTWAALSKLANPTAMLGSVYAYALPLPDPLLRLAAVTLPWLELLCGLLLCANLWGDAVRVLLPGLLLFFLAVTGQAWARGLDIACGCFSLRAFGLDADAALLTLLESARGAFLRNLALLALALFLLVTARRTEERPVVE